MPGAAKITRTDTLLAERERQGVRMLTAVRGLFILVMVVSHWVVGFSVFEKIAATVIGIPAFGLICVFFAMLVDRRPVAAVGLAGSLMDVAILGMLPVIWYVSVGGADVPPAYMPKTQITVLTLGLVALNALAIRPLYPIVVAGGGVAVHVALLVYILRDPRTIISPDFTESAMGPALSLELFATDLLVIVLAGAALAFLTFLARRTIFQGVKLEVANASLARHFSPGVVSRIVGESEPLSGVGGRTQDVAVMFCDIRDFTTMTENLPPPDVVAFLSQYHARMVDVIFGFGGTIDKFIGDAIMVTFGTPDTAEDDAERAVRAGLVMNTALAGLNAERTERGLPEIRHGIGIHYGPVIAGNIGTEDRLEYTVIGDTVNVASRIQDACKTAGENLLISEAVGERLPPDFGVRPLPEQHVRGRKAPVQIYAVVEGLSSG